jgi:hypothetical protein
MRAFYPCGRQPRCRQVAKIKVPPAAFKANHWHELKYCASMVSDANGAGFIREHHFSENH